MNIDELKKNAVSEDKPSGFIIIDGQEVAHTKQCCHCGIHFVSVKGSGKIRGFCIDCNKITCGSPGCDLHVPFEVKLDATDGGNLSNSGLLKQLNPYKEEIHFLLDKYGRVL